MFQNLAVGLPSDFARRPQFLRFPGPHLFPLAVPPIPPGTGLWYDAPMKSIFPRFDGELFVLGLMSGTSGDGIDGTLVRFPAIGQASGTAPAGNAGFELLWHDSWPFSAAVRERLQTLMRSCDADAVALAAGYMAELYSHAVLEFRKRHAEPIDLLAAHGQTLAHVPQTTDWDGFKIRGTLQALNPAWLAEKTGIPVANDFRSRDLAVDGEGAPLVPFADLQFFGHLPGDTAALNVGGIANLTIIRHLPPAKGVGQPTISPAPVVTSAFDTGPGNMLIDAFVMQKTAGRESFDRDGRRAAAGRTDESLLGRWLGDSYFSRTPPKSTGRDRYGGHRLPELLQHVNPRLSENDIVSTLLDLTVVSIADALDRFVFTEGKLHRVIIAGGGAENRELVKRLAGKLPRGCKLERSDQHGVPVFAREAMAFAALGAALLRGTTANVLQATGAKKAVVLGSLTP